jgi:hypothetical protein
VILATAVVHLLDPAIKQIGLINTYEYGGCISNAWGEYPYPVSGLNHLLSSELMIAWNLHRRYILHIRNRPSSSPTRPSIPRKTWNFNGDAGESRTRSTSSQYSTARDRYRVRRRGSKWVGTLRRGNSKSSRIYDYRPDTFCR